MIKKNFILTVLISSVLIAIIASIYFFSFVKNEEAVKKMTQNNQILSECLNVDADVSYKFEKKETPLANVVIRVTDKNTGEETSSFGIDNIFKTSTSVELHKCGVYVIRFFNYNPNKSKQDTGFRAELWKYQYTNEGNIVLVLAEKDNGVFSGNYSLAFRIDPLEKYIVLEKGYLGKDDYALVIKDLNTKEDIFVLSAKSTFEQYPDMVGSFGFDTWTKNGRYFWGDIFDGAYVNAYFRIDTQNWKYDIFEAPDGAMGGSPLNINTGYLPIQPGQIWTGDYQLTQELKEKERKEGKKSSLYLYNLFTKEKIFIETTDEPLFWFTPQWLSDTELQYELPSGEKKIYKINENN